MAESLLSPRRISATERQQLALELRKTGMTYASIAKQLGFRNASSAYEAIKSALRKSLQPSADEVRALEAERLDALMSMLWPSAQQGDGDAIDRILRIMERRARLLGLDAPVQYSGETVTHVFSHTTVAAAITARSSGDSDASGEGADSGDRS